MDMKLLWGNPFKKNIPDLENDIDFLSTVSLFDSLTRRQKYRLFSSIHIRHYKQGEIVFRQDDPGVGLYIVRGGLVDVYNEYSDMTRNKIAELSKGEVFGEIALLNDSLRSATVVASKETVLFAFFRTDFLNLMDSDPKIGVKLIYSLAKTMAERLRLINEDTTLVS
ncbi:cyclic nucleotide-binding domain-containing protein [Candidatus Latescibacterota bacterium]